jgi:hypothetical protein
MTGSGQNPNASRTLVCQLPPAADIRRIGSGPLCATRRHMQCSKRTGYSITSSALASSIGGIYKGCLIDDRLLAITRTTMAVLFEIDQRHRLQIQNRLHWHHRAMFLPRPAAGRRLLSWSVKTRTAHQAGADGTTGREASWCKMPISSECAGEPSSLKASIGFASVTRLSRVSRRMR